MNADALGGALGAHGARNVSHDINAHGNLGANLNPSKWGPGAWNTLHSFALRADAIRDYEEFTTFFNSFSRMLPCDSCRNDFSRYTFPGSDAFDWTVKIHNEVNKKLGKPLKDAHEMRLFWTECNECTKEPLKEKKSNTYKFLVLAAFFAIFCAYIAYKCL